MNKKRDELALEWVQKDDGSLGHCAECFKAGWDRCCLEHGGEGYISSLAELQTLKQERDSAQATAKHNRISAEGLKGELEAVKKERNECAAGCVRMRMVFEHIRDADTSRISNSETSTVVDECVELAKIGLFPNHGRAELEAITKCASFLYESCICQQLADPQDRSRYAGYQKHSGYCSYCRMEREICVAFPGIKSEESTERRPQ